MVVAIKVISVVFECLWNFDNSTEETLVPQANCFKEIYSNAIFGNIWEESLFPRKIASVDFHFEIEPPKKTLEQTLRLKLANVFQLSQ